MGTGGHSLTHSVSQSVAGQRRALSFPLLLSSPSPTANVASSEDCTETASTYGGAPLGFPTARLNIATR